MDFNTFFPGQHFGYVNGAIPLHASFHEEPSKLSGAGEGGETEAFDPSAMFQTPYDAFRFDHHVVPSPDIGDISISVPPTAEETPQPLSMYAQDASDSQAAECMSRNERRSSSDENRLTPAQSRRKAQNRAAQRAFRERKEKHVKELETKLTSLESSATNLASDNQRLKLALQRAMTENEMLRATTGSGRGGAPMVSNSKRRALSPSSRQAEGDKGTEGEGGRATGNPSSYPEEGGSEQADAGAKLNLTKVWDYIVEHPLVKAGRVDILDTRDRLRKHARPGGRGGPIFYERDVRQAIENSRRSGGDALI